MTFADDAYFIDVCVRAMTQDSENVAEGLMTASKGKIRTGVYHADVGDGEKERLHRLWREGQVKVVCATIGERHLGRDATVVLSEVDDRSVRFGN